MNKKTSIIIRYKTLPAGSGLFSTTDVAEATRKMKRLFKAKCYARATYKEEQIGKVWKEGKKWNWYMDTDAIKD
jgi:hypothetical protein